MISTLHSLHLPDKIFKTGERPVLITCNDFNPWVCKHSRDASQLFNELIGSVFATIWELNTPPISFIKVSTEHIPQELAPINFSKTSFGSLYLKSSKEVDKSVVSMFDDASFRSKIRDREDFLKIALFDIWLANEDRNHNNMNLLLSIDDSNFMKFTVIDHGTIFNTNALHRGIYQLNEFDSILSTNVSNLLFHKSQRLNKIVDDLLINFYICVEKCKLSIDNILNLVPVDWNLDKDRLKTFLLENLFTNEWLNECEDNFRALVQANIH